MSVPDKSFIDYILEFIEKHYYLFLSIIYSVAAFNLFYNLCNVPISSWDEARHGISAYEMLRNNNYIINTFEYTTDYWNLKPPISFWAICLGYKLAGFNAMGLRLFSAVAAIITIIVVTLFTKYRNGKLASLISASVLVTSSKYIISHCARTGDADSIFVLFFTLALVSVSLIERNINWLYFSGLFTALAFLTKSWHALSIVAITGIYLLISKAFLKISIKKYLIYISTMGFPIILWGIGRYSMDGFAFFKKMISFDLLDRSTKTLEGHIGGPDYYLHSLERGYSSWGIVLFISVIAYLFCYAGEEPDKSNRNYISLMVLWISIPLMIYNLASTKIDWYILYIYPALAISIGGLSGKLLRGTRRNEVIQLILCLGILFSLYKYERIIQIKVTNYYPDNIQQTIRRIEEKKEYIHANIYTQYLNNNTNHWRQCDVLAAELYADLIPKEGGLETFLKDKSNTLLIVPKSQEYLDMIKRRKLNIIIEGDEVLILGK